MKILLFHAHSGDPLSFVIKAMSRSAYCHAAVLVEEPILRKGFIDHCELAVQGSNTVRPVIVEAYYPHVRARCLDSSELAEIDVVDVAGVTPEIEAASMAWAMSCIQKQVEYGIADLFRFTAPGRTLLGEDDDHSYLKHTICSQFAFNVFRMGGIRLLNCHDFEVRPDQLLWSPFAKNLGKLSDYLRGTGLGQVPPPSQWCAQHVGRISTPIQNNTNAPVGTDEESAQMPVEASGYQPEATAAGSSGGAQ